MKYIIFGNYGNETIALMQWAYETQLEQVVVVSVETGWAAETWQARVEKGQALAHRYNFKEVRLKSASSFAELVEQRGQFPNQKFQWCAGILKGLPLLDWLDSIDPSCEETILLGKRKQASRAYRQLSERIEMSEHYGERNVWHPLLNLTDNEFGELIERANFDYLNHRSLECDPCIHSIKSDFYRFSLNTIQKTEHLENKVGESMFPPMAFGGAKIFSEVVEFVRQQQDNGKNQKVGDVRNKSCGTPYGCGE